MGFPLLGTPDLSRTQVLLDTFNRSNFEHSAFSGFKVASMGRKRKKQEKSNKTRKKVF